MRRVVDVPLPGGATPPVPQGAVAEQMPLPADRQEQEPPPRSPQPSRYKGDLPFEARMRMTSLVIMKRRTTDPVYNADHRTSMGDARIAVSIAKGVPFDDIDPSDGTDLRHHVYLANRESWREHVEGHGWSEYYDRPAYEEAFAYWAVRRPQFTDGDDWVADLIPATSKPKGEEQ